MVTRLRGTPTPAGTDWSNPDLLPIQTLAPAEPSTRGEAIQISRGAYFSGWKLYLPADADLDPQDRIMVRGTTYSVVGQPEVWLGAGIVVDVADVWTATCTIRHPGGTRGAFDSATGTYPTVPFQPYYAGGCRIELLSTEDQRLLFADEPLTGAGYLVIVDLPASNDSRLDDLVTVTAVDGNGDPMLVGQELSVRSLERGAMPWARNLQCTFLLPKS